VLTPFSVRGVVCAALPASEWRDNDEELIVLSGEAADFEALTDAANVVVKTPSALDDKFWIEQGL
jgi:hypothetical protein